MTKVSEQILQILFAHLSVQSILDMKDNFGVVSIGQLIDMNKQCWKSFPIKVNHKAMAVVFVFDAQEVYNVIIYTGNHFARNKAECLPQLQSVLDELATKREINAIVYSNARQTLSMLASIGFRPRKEKDKYIVLEYKK